MDNNMTKTKLKIITAVLAVLTTLTLLIGCGAEIYPITYQCRYDHYGNQKCGYYR